MAKPVSTVLIVMAMAHEANAIVEKFALKLDEVPSPTKGPLVIYSGQVGTGDVHLITNGQSNVYEEDGLGEGGAPVRVERVSVTPASISTWEGIRLFKPDVVLSVGTAGGVKAKGIEKRGVYLATSPVRFFDRLIDFRAPGDTYTVTNYKCYGIGNFPVLPTPKLIEALSLKTAAVGTGSSFAAPEGNVKTQFDASEIAVKEMEAAAVAEVAESLSTPFLAIKGVSDWIDVEFGDAQSDEFAQNLGPVSDIVADVTHKVVTYIIGKTLAEL